MSIEANSRKSRCSPLTRALWGFFGMFGVAVLTLEVIRLLNTGKTNIEQTELFVGLALGVGAALRQFYTCLHSDER